MSDSKPEVEVRADQGTESLGKSAYFAAKDGRFDSNGFKSSILVAFGITALIFAGMIFSKKPLKSSNAGKGLPSPAFVQSNPGVSPKVLTERDLTNIIKSTKIGLVSPGRIRVVNLRTATQLPAGTEVTAVLASGASDGIVKARLTAPLLVDDESVLPEGTGLFGRGKSGDERLFIEFNKATLPSGESFPIRAQAFDIGDKMQGLKGAVVGTRTKKMIGAMAFGLLGGMADGLQGTSGSLWGQKPSTRDAALAGASKAALDQSQVYIDDMKKSPNIIEVKTGTEIIVIIDEPKRKERYDEK